jgi:hypothetical protein
MDRPVTELLMGEKLEVQVDRCLLDLDFDPAGDRICCHQSKKIEGIKALHHCIHGLGCFCDSTRRLGLHHLLIH